MAGAATSGRARRARTCSTASRGFSCLATPPPRPWPRAREFVERLGATPVVFDDDGSEHDRVMAAVSHLPQVVASALMAVVGDAAGESGLRWAGSGLRDSTRLADSSASMWESIFASNQAELRPLLLTMADALRGMADHLDDPATVRRLFEVAHRHRRQLG